MFDALSRAGGRLLTPAYRGQFKSTPRHELHTVIPIGPGHLDRLLEGSFQFTDNIASAYGINHDKLRSGLRAYVRNRLTEKAPHDRNLLRGYLTHDYS